jgi:maltose alpha-D-glucosyltransferase / alpha-amylase
VGTAQWLEDAADEQPITLMALFEHVGDQGDAWTYTLNHLERHLSSMLSDGRVDAPQPHSLFNSQMRTLGRRVAQLHAVLASDTSDPAFAPEAVTSSVLRQWCDELLARLGRTLDALQAQLHTLQPAVQHLARQVLLRRTQLNAGVSRELAARAYGPIHSIYTRYHGNLQLTEVLLRADDFLITGFEGGPGYAPADCRSKHSPLRDVASVLRSFDLGTCRGGASDVARSGNRRIPARLRSATR